MIAPLRTLAVASAVALLASSVVACGSSPAAGDDVAQAEEELRTSYGDLFDTLAPADLDRWVDARRKLEEGFDRICGDTICGGDFSNLSTVRISCASTYARRKMKDCVWVLGGSVDYVDPGNGKLTGEARAFTCRIPVAGNAGPFLDALAAAGDDALVAKLPGTDGSFYDGLVACFEGVQGAPPPATTEGDFVELGDLLWEEGAAGSAWAETRRKLAEGFDDACGDAFCEGEYPDVTPLRFACSANRQTGYVQRCAWTFALADTDVDSRGNVRARTTTKRCAVGIDATKAELTAALGGPNPLRAKLPGKTTSIYDALVGCL